MTPLELVTQVAVRQRMLLATWQAVAAGVDPDVLLHRVKEQGWRRWHWGVISLPGPPDEMRAAMAAVLAYSRPRTTRRAATSSADVDELVASARSGQLLWGPSALWAYRLASAPAATYIRLPQRSGHIPRAGVELRYGALDASYLRLLDGFPVPTPEQAILEFSGSLASKRDGHREVSRVIARADGRRLANVQSLTVHLGEAGPVKGIRHLRRSLAELEGTLSHSQTEGRARAIVTAVAARYGFTVHTRPLEIRLGGTIVGEADVAVIELSLDIEVDGPHHRLLKQREEDQERDRRVRRAGWFVERFSVELLDESPQVFEARVDEAIRSTIRLRKLEHVHLSRA